MAASPALAPPPGNPRFPLMDALRGLAAVAIVLGHSYDGLHQQATLQEHGYWDNLANTLGVGVQVFFALSGFLLVRPYLAAHARGEAGPGTLTFWRRRVLRIVPAYWVALTVTAIAVPSAAVGAFSDRWWLFYGFGQTYSEPDRYHGLGVAWSLSVEATFYLLLPWLALLLRRVGARPVIAALLVLGIGVRVANSVDIGATLNPIFVATVYGLPGEATFFAVGMAVAHWSVEGPPGWLRALAARPGWCWAAAGALYLAMSAVLSFANPVGGLDFRTRFIAWDFAAVVFVLLVMVPTAFDERHGVVRRLLLDRRMVFVGVVSYSLYLWHVPLEKHLLDHGLFALEEGWALLPRSALTFFLVLCGSLLTATISYYVVELPFLRLKEPRRGQADPMGRPGERAGAVAGGVRRS